MRSTTPFGARLVALALISIVAGGCGGASSAPPASSVGTQGPTAELPTPAVSNSPTATSARPPLDSGVAWIAYQNRTPERSGAHAVHLIRPDGTGDFFALDAVPGGQQKHPDWSPDGTQLMVDVSNATDTSDIWVASVIDWSARKVVDCSAPCLWVEEPAWSHDGTRVAYQRHTTAAAGEIATIEVLDLASGSTTVVYQTGTDKGVYAPRWSPDDTSLVFEQTASGGDTFLGVSLEVLDLATPGVTRSIVPVERMANNADWSPDGKLIAFSAPTSGGEPGGPLSDIWVVNADGTQPRQVTDVAAAAGTALQPTFTPDGTGIIFKLTDARLGAFDAIALVPTSGGVPRSATGANYLFGWHSRMRPIG